jgi:hypothetical protein
MWKAAAILHNAECTNVMMKKRPLSGQGMGVNE